ncbi:hypothetical protein BJ912DRAFT_984344 [Pholiota molesta]|nr:hypothetical protein BJ912DRAFT_984344 [Pholiota molesta]
MRLLIQIPCFEDPVSAGINRICGLSVSVCGLTALNAYVSCMGRVPSCVGAIEHVVGRGTRWRQKTDKHQPIVVPPSPSVDGLAVVASRTYLHHLPGPKPTTAALIGACTAAKPANETKPASPQCGSPSAHQRPQNPHAQQDGRGATRQLPARCIQARKTSATKETPGGANWPPAIAVGSGRVLPLGPPGVSCLPCLQSPKAGPRPWVWFLGGSNSATRKKRNGNR